MKIIAEVEFNNTIKVNCISDIKSGDRLFYELGEHTDVDEKLLPCNWVRNGKFKEIKDVNEYLTLVKNTHKEADKLKLFIEHHNFTIVRGLTKGTPTHTIDITGDTICLGDLVDYDFERDDPRPFEVVFEENTFRKKYAGWDETLCKPTLETGERAKEMKLRIVRKYNQ